MGSAPPAEAQRPPARRDAGAPQLSSLAAAQSLARVLRPCYGPLGRHKLLVPARGPADCTRSTAPILRALRLDHPAARLLRDAAQAQAERGGGGAAFVVLLGAALLSEAEALLAAGLGRPHVLRGLERAAAECGARLPELAVRALGPLQDARWALAAAVGARPPGLAGLVARACAELRGPDGGFAAERLAVCALRGAGPERSRLLPGLAVPGRPLGAREAAVRGARVAVFAGPLGPPGARAPGRARLESAGELAARAGAAERWAERQAGLLAAAGATAAAAGGEVDPRVVAQAERRGLLVLRLRGRADAEALSRALGAPPPPAPAPCRRVYPLDDDGGDEDARLLVFEPDAPGPAATLLLRAPTDAGLREAERAARRGVAVFARLCGDPRLLPGAGAAEMALAARLDERGAREPGPDGAGLQAFARALRALPAALAENAGLDVPAVLAELRAAARAGRLLLGVGADGLIDVDLEEVWDPLAVKAEALRAAAGLAGQLVAVDEIVVARPLEPASPAPGSPDGGEKGRRRRRGSRGL